MIGAAFLYVVAFLLVVAVCVHHYIQQQKISDDIDKECQIIKRATKNIIIASNLVTRDGRGATLLALLHANSAQQSLNDVVLRRGVGQSSKLSGVDVGEIVKKAEGLCHQLTERITNDYPELAPKTVIDGQSNGIEYPGAGEFEDDYDVDTTEYNPIRAAARKAMLLGSRSDDSDNDESDDDERYEYSD